MLEPHSTVSGRSVVSRHVTVGIVEQAALLLDGAAVGEHAARAGLERARSRRSRTGRAAGCARPAATSSSASLPRVRGWTLQTTGRSSSRATASRPSQMTAQALRDVDGLLPVGGDEQVAVALERRGARARRSASQRGRKCSRISVIGLPVTKMRCGAMPSASRSRASAAVYGSSHVADVVDELAVLLLGHASVEAAVAGLHVEDRDVVPRRGDRGEAAVGVAEDQQRVGPELEQRRLAAARISPIWRRRARPGSPR